MNDIENLDPEDYEIKNKYSKNPYWKEASSTENIDAEEFEYQKEVKEYLNKKEIIQNIFNVLNYRLTKVAFIFVACCMFFMYFLSLICIFISIQEKQTQGIDAMYITGIVCVALGMYVLIEISILNKKFPFRHTKVFKQYAKAIRKNRRKFIKWSRTVVPPTKPEELPDEEWWE